MFKRDCGNIKKGQSVLEYTLLLAAVIGVIVIALLGTGSNTGMKGSINATYQKSASVIQNNTNDLNSSGVFLF